MRSFRLPLQEILERWREEPSRDPRSCGGLQLPPFTPRWRPYTDRKRLPGNTNHPVETDKFLNQGGEKLNIDGFQAWLREWTG